MADNGELYAIFSKEFPKEMAKLCKKADLLIPNLTEASLLLEEPYMADGTYTQADIEGLLKRLSDLCQGDVVLTGISFEPEKLGAAVYERKTDKIAYAFTQRIEGYYHGTGDVFCQRGDVRCVKRIYACSICTNSGRFYSSCHFYAPKMQEQTFVSA